MTTNGVIKVQQLADKSLDGIWTDGGAIFAMCGFNFLLRVSVVETQYT